VGDGVSECVHCRIEKSGLVETPPAQVDRADFQRTLAAIQRRLEQLASDPDLVVTSAFVKLVPEPAFDRVPAGVEVLGDHLDGAPDHRHLADQITVDFLQRPSTAVQVLPFMSVRFPRRWKQFRVGFRTPSLLPQTLTVSSTSAVPCAVPPRRR
jgi:hypothetical protein